MSDHQDTPPAPGYRCADVNLPLGLRCDRPHGHAGAHVQDNGASQQGWGFVLDGYTTTTETTTT